MATAAGFEQKLSRPATQEGVSPALSRLTIQVLWILFLGLFAFQLIGILPLTPLNGDSLGIANGVKNYANDGSFALGYRYQSQPGTYVLVLLVSESLRIEPHTAFAALTGLCAVVFAILSAIFLSSVLHFPVPLCGLIVVLFPETFASAYFANSTVIAAAIFMVALHLIRQRPDLSNLLASGLLLGCSGWARYDVLLMAPCIAVLLYKHDWKQACSSTTIVAVVSAGMALILTYACGITPFDVLNQARGHYAYIAKLPESMDFRIHVCFFSVLLMILILLGFLKMVRDRCFAPLALVVVGITPLYIFYYGTMVSPKYLYYGIPFFSIPAVVGLAGILTMPEGKSWFLSVLLAAFVFQYLLGFRQMHFDPTKIPTLLEFNVDPITIRTSDYLYEIPVSVVVGAGSPVITHHELRLTSGLLSAPFMWHRQKRVVEENCEQLRKYMRKLEDDFSIFAIGWPSYKIIQDLLLDDRFLRTNNERFDDLWADRETWTKRGRVIYLIHLDYLGHLGGRPLALRKTSNVIIASTLAYILPYVISKMRSDLRFNNISGGTSYMGNTLAADAVLGGTLDKGLLK
ncbi:MAG: hypothetical protein ACLP5H_14640 [Desulfomonilaceae bacterium]